MEKRVNLRRKVIQIFTSACAKNTALYQNAKGMCEYINVVTQITPVIIKINYNSSDVPCDR